MFKTIDRMLVLTCSFTQHNIFNDVIKLCPNGLEQCVFFVRRVGALVRFRNSAVVGNTTPRFDFPLANKQSGEHQSHSERRYLSQTAAAGGLTARTVRPSPAWFTLAGVGGHAVAMNTVFRTVGWQKQGEREKVGSVSNGDKRTH